MSELDESSNLEMSGPAGDSGAGRGPEVGESGPAGVAESAAEAIDHVLRDAGEVASKAAAVGREGLTEVGKLAGEAESAGVEGLRKAGDIAGAGEADAGKAFEAAGKFAGVVAADGAKALEDVGAAAGKLESVGSFLSVGWDAGAAAETGESGPAGPLEQFDAPGSAAPGAMERAIGQVDAVWDAGQLQGLDMVQAADTGSWDNVLAGGGWNTGAALETGESGPAESLETAVEVLGESLEVAAEEGAAEATEESSGDSARVASSRSVFTWEAASLDRLADNLPQADRARDEGRGR